MLLERTEGRPIWKRQLKRAGWLRPLTLKLEPGCEVGMDQYTRRIVGFAVHRKTLDGPTICGMLSRIISGTPPPTCLSSDNDPLFEFHCWKANLRILEIEEIKTVPYVPMSHPFVQRLIGTIRREYLDHVPFWNARDLERKLSCFQDYYNRERAHQRIGGVLPEP